MIHVNLNAQPVEVWFYMNGPSNLAAPILANIFLVFNYVFTVQVWYICLNFIDLSKKSTFYLFKTELKAKKLFARNQCSQLRRAAHIKPDLIIEVKSW